MRPLFIKIFGGLASTLTPSRDHYGRSRSSSGKIGHSSRSGGGRSSRLGTDGGGGSNGTHHHPHHPGGGAGGGGLIKIPSLNNLKSELTTTKKSWLSGPSAEDGYIDPDGADPSSDMTPLSTLPPVTGTFVTAGGGGGRKLSFDRPPSRNNHHYIRDYWDNGGGHGNGNGRRRGDGDGDVENGGVRIGVDEILVSNTIEVRDDRRRSLPRLKTGGPKGGGGGGGGGRGVVVIDRGEGEEEREGVTRVNTTTPEGSLDDQPRNDRDMV